MPPAQRFGFVGAAAMMGLVATNVLALQPFFKLLLACLAGFVGSSIVRVLVTPRQATLKIGKENFTYTRYDRDATKRSLGVFLGSLYYYSIAGVVVWAVLSWAVVSFSLSNPVFLLTAGPNSERLRIGSLNNLYSVVFYLGLSLAIGTWTALYISELLASQALARLLPLGLALCAGYAEYDLLLLAPAWIFLVAGFASPFVVIPWATSMCTQAGLRGRNKPGGSF